MIKEDLLEKEVLRLGLKRRLESFSDEVTGGIATVGSS